jgi:hypothetical protein
MSLLSLSVNRLFPRECEWSGFARDCWRRMCVRYAQSTRRVNIEAKVKPTAVLTTHFQWDERRSYVNIEEKRRHVVEKDFTQPLLPIFTIRLQLA